MPGRHVPAGAEAPDGIRRRSMGAKIWEAEIGRSYSHVGVANGIVYAGTRHQDANEASSLYAHDAVTGARLATFPLPTVVRARGSRRNSVYIGFGNLGAGGLLALSLCARTGFVASCQRHRPKESVPTPADRVKQETQQLIKAVKCTSPPVDVEGIARYLGAQVIYEPFTEDMSGVLVKEKKGIVIGVNSSVFQNASAIHDRSRMWSSSAQPQRRNFRCYRTVRSQSTKKLLHDPPWRLIATKKAAESLCCGIAYAGAFLGRRNPTVEPRGLFGQLSE